MINKIELSPIAHDSKITKDDEADETRTPSKIMTASASAYREPHFGPSDGVFTPTQSDTTVPNKNNVIRKVFHELYTSEL